MRISDWSSDVCSSDLVRAALLEKALPFEFVATRASQDAAFRVLSPLGKIPVLDTGEGYLSETVAILDYLDDAYPDVPLRHSDAFSRARSRQIINLVDRKSTRLNSSH